MTPSPNEHSSGHAGAGHAGIRGTPLRGSGTPLSSELFGNYARMKRSLPFLFVAAAALVLGFAAGWLRGTPDLPVPFGELSR
jgi:hypothetical protein